MRPVYLITILSFLYSAAFAQLKTPAASPSISIEQEMGISKVKLTYSRPGVKGRKVFGDLVPYGKVWRTGANASTTLEFSEPLSFAGQSVPAGKYAIYTIPNEGNWTVMVSKALGWGAGNYDKSMNVAEFEVKAEQLENPYETFTIDFSDFTQNGAYMNIKWENTKVSFPLEMKTDEQVIAQLERMMKNPEASLAGTYYQAAQYYFDTDRDTEKALTWVNKALEYNPNPYWVIRLKSRILAKKKDYKAAIETAKMSVEKATEAGNMDYVKLNNDAIAKWEKMQ